MTTRLENAAGRPSSNACVRVTHVGTSVKRIRGVRCGGAVTEAETGTTMLLHGGYKPRRGERESRKRERNRYYLGK